MDGIAWALLGAILMAILPLLYKPLKMWLLDLGYFEAVLLLADEKVRKLAEEVFAQIKEALKDGKLSEKEREDIIASFKQVAKEQRLEFLEEASPKIYEMLFEYLLKRARS